MTEEIKFLDRLKDVHEFPCEFVFKVIGDNSPEFVTTCVQGTINVLGPKASIDVKTRESSKGNHVAVTLLVVIDAAEHVLKVFEILQGIEGVKYVL